MNVSASVEYIVAPSIVLLINLVIIGFVVRQKRARFGGYRYAFALGFAFTAIASLTRILGQLMPQEPMGSTWWKMGITAAMCSGGAFAGIATRLYWPPTSKTEWQTIAPTVKRPPLLILIVALLSIAALAWILTPFTLVGVYAVFEPWYGGLLALAGFLAASYMSVFLWRYSTRLDARTRHDVRIFVCGFVLYVIGYLLIGF